MDRDMEQVAFERAYAWLRDGKYGSVFVTEDAEAIAGLMVEHAQFHLAAAVLAEREACASAVESLADGTMLGEAGENAYRLAAATIRARGA